MEEYLMKNVTKFLSCLVLIGFIFAQDTTGSLDTTKTTFGNVWWILVHPSNAPDGSGIFLYDEKNDNVLRQLNLPAEIISPHALAFDGKNLWLGDAASPRNPGYADSGTIYQISPRDGSVLSKIQIRGGTEGIALTRTSLWYSQTRSGKLFNITMDGQPLKQLQVSVSTINDIAFDGEWLYYVINDANDRIVRVDPNTGAENNFITKAVKSKQIYTLAVDNNYLVVIDKTNNAVNQIRRLDKKTGNFISDTSISIRGWITAIALDR
jgi:DNA-binding beta-propeller fold protein YncE